MGRDAEDQREENEERENHVLAAGSHWWRWGSGLRERGSALWALFCGFGFYVGVGIEICTAMAGQKRACGRGGERKWYCKSLQKKAKEKRKKGLV